MTRENAKKQLMHIIAFLNPQLDGADIKALNMAISALEQEPCDTISRSELMNDILTNFDEERCDYTAEEFLSMVCKAPSVQPKPIECDDAISRESVLALAKDIVVSDYRHRCIDPQLVRELPSVQPSRTQMVDKSNFDIRQYRADLDSAYECGKASNQPSRKVIEDIKAEIELARYGLVNDGLDLALKIIDKHIKQ